MWVVYGIKNCDSVKKACAWLEARSIDYRFHDYRVNGLDAERVQLFIDRLGADAILNQRSTSWRQLDEGQKRDLTPDKTAQLLLTVPTLIKRPIIDTGKQWLVGFNPDILSALT